MYWPFFLLLIACMSYGKKIGQGYITILKMHVTTILYRCFYRLFLLYVLCCVLFAWKCQKCPMRGGVDWHKTFSTLEDKPLQSHHIEHEVFGSVMLNNVGKGLLFSKLTVDANLMDNSVRTIKYVFYPATLPFMDSCIQDGAKGGLYSHPITFLDEKGHVVAYIPEQNVTVNSSSETIVLHTDMSLKLLSKQPYYINAISFSQHKIMYNKSQKTTQPNCFQAPSWDRNIIQALTNLKKCVIDQVVLSLTSDQLVHSIKHGEKIGFILSKKGTSPVNFIEDMIKNSRAWPKVCGVYNDFWVMPASSVLSSEVPLLNCLFSDIEIYCDKYAFIQYNNHYKLIPLSTDYNSISGANGSTLSKIDGLKRKLAACGIHGKVLARLQDDDVKFILNNIDSKHFDVIDRQMCMLQLATIVQVLYDIAEGDPSLNRDSFGSGSFSIEDCGSILFKKLQSCYGIYSRNPKEKKSSHYKDSQDQYGIDIKLSTEFSNLLPHSRGDGHHILFGRVKKGNNALVTFIKSEPYGIQDPKDKLRHAREYVHTLGEKSKNAEHTSRETALPISIKKVMDKISYKGYSPILKREIWRCTQELYNLIPFLKVLHAIMRNPEVKSKTALCSVDLEVIQETYCFLKKAVRELQGGEKLLYIRTGNEYVVDQLQTNELIKILSQHKFPISH